MKKLSCLKENIFILALILIIIPGNIIAQVKTEFLLEDRIVFDDYIEYIKPWKSNSKDLIMEKTALFFLGKPYVAHTLDQNVVEQLIVNFREFDCFTFVETVIALSMTALEEEPTIEAYADNLKSIRYRDKVILGYHSRLHYTIDWIYENSKNGIMKDITSEIGGVKDNKIINFMSEHRTSYNQLTDDDTTLNEIIKVETKINDRGGFYYLPKDKIAKSDSLIPHMSVVGFTTSLEGLDVTHVSFAFRKDRELKFIHASSVLNEIVIDKQLLSNYCNSRSSCTGIIIAKVL